jgi:leucyl aminopeptidase (aminopeptidase T)
LDYSEIAYKIVNFVLNLKPGQSVSISSEIHNVFEHDEPLAQIPFLEELAIVVRKNRGLPVLDISTENLHKRFFDEISDDPPELGTELLKKWIETADMFVDLGWRSNPLFYKTIPERSYNRLNLFDKDYFKLFENKGKKLVLLGFPTVGLAKYLGIDHSILKKTYFAALNINYYDLKKRCNIIDTAIKKHKNWNIETEFKQLQVEFIDEAHQLYGDMTNEFIITLPTGVWVQAINTQNLNGSIYCQQVYHDQYSWADVRLVFEHGKIISIETEQSQKSLNLMKTMLYDEITNMAVQIGLNYCIKERCHYHLFDSVKYKNISLMIKTPKGHLIALSEKAALYHDKDQDILDEV